jgi:hypothetical protein
VNNQQFIQAADRLAGDQDHGNERNEQHVHEDEWHWQGSAAADR